ncbi:hypothetical protein [Burkholderia sp. Ac-20353]|uniref:hypothetical protein n=1 Tax=Burkholderia sp. Ac-20353 TaxID=2703894 RepID=UPI00197CA0EC|nr:hypothetical protein [Burkholderia sp. Ac-20353]MBN3793086.1 hypothetical protein [Burkholderia sp. Ac-20353]
MRLTRCGLVRSQQKIRGTRPRTAVHARYKDAAAHIRHAVRGHAALFSTLAPFLHTGRARNRATVATAIRARRQP